MAPILGRQKSGGLSALPRAAALADLQGIIRATEHLRKGDTQPLPSTRAPLTVRGRILLFLFFFIGLGAIAGSIGVMKDLIPFPEVWLQGTLFHSYFFPGLIL